MDKNRLYNADCIKALNKIEDNSIDLIVTSPPYFNAKDYSKWDSYKGFLDFMERTFREAFKKLKGGRICAVNVSVVIQKRGKRSEESKRIPIPFHLVGIMERIGYQFLEDIVWEKPDGASKNRNGGFYRHRQPIAYKPNIVNEYILIFKKPNGKLIDHTIRSIDKKTKELSLVKDGYERTNIWKINPSTNTSDHPAKFPIEIPEKIIRYYSYIKDVVLDIFMGSGTTGIAANKLKRQFVGIEIDKDFFEISKRNIELSGGLVREMD